MMMMMTIGKDSHVGVWGACLKKTWPCPALKIVVYGIPSFLCGCISHEKNKEDGALKASFPHIFEYMCVYDILVRGQVHARIQIGEIILNITSNLYQYTVYSVHGAWNSSLIYLESRMKIIHKDVRMYSYNQNHYTIAIKGC